MTVEPREVMHGLEAFGLQAWIAKNRHRMIPPISNETIFKGNDTFIVMVSSGPNTRKDYHYNESEELFLQLEGDIEIGLYVDGEHRAETVREGELFLIPPKVPHQPRRPAGHARADPGEAPRARRSRTASCTSATSCGEKLFEQYFFLEDIVQQFPMVQRAFYYVARAPHLQGVRPRHRAAAELGRRASTARERREPVRLRRARRGARPLVVAAAVRAHHVIGDALVGAGARGTFATHDPHDGSWLADVPVGGPEEVDAAVRAARAAFPAWAALGPRGPAAAAARAGRPRRPRRRGARAAGDARQRQADPPVARRHRPQRAQPALLRRLGGARRRRGVGRRPPPHLRALRAGRRRGLHQPVELPAHAGHVEGRAGARVRLHARC